MARLRRSLILLAGTAGALLLLLMLLLLLAPWLINTSAFEQKIRRVIADRTGKSLTYRSLAIAFFPRPRLTIEAMRLSLPDRASADIGALHVYPEILPLFTGSIHLAKVSMARPEVLVELASPAAKKRQANGRRKPKPNGPSLADALAELRTYAPGLLWEVDEGALAIRAAGGRSWSVREVSARFHLLPQGADLAVAGTFDRWGEFSAEGRIEVPDKDVVALSSAAISTAKSSVSGLSARFSKKKEWSVSLAAGKAVLRLDQLFPRIVSLELLRGAPARIDFLEGTVILSRLGFQGPLAGPEKGAFDIRAAVENLAIGTPDLPDRLRVPRAEFTLAKTQVTVARLDAALLDTAIAATAAVALAAPNVQAADLSCSGTVGPRTTAWLASAFPLPAVRMVRTPFSFSDTRLQWERNGATALQSVLKMPDGPSVAARARWNRDEFNLEHLEVRDAGSAAFLSVLRRKDIVDLAFRGDLRKASLERLFGPSPYDFGSLSGEVRAKLDLSRPLNTRAWGALRVDGLLVSGPLPEPLQVKHASLRAEDDRIMVESADLAMTGHEASLSGAAFLSKAGIRVDADLRIPALDVKKLLPLFKSSEKPAPKTAAAAEKQPKPSPALAGVLRLELGSLSYGTYALQHVNATLHVNPDGIQLQVGRATFCGISLAGSLAQTGKDLALRVRPTAAGLDLEPALACALGKDLRISGKADLSADLAAQGPAAALLDNLSGPVRISAKDGEILQATILTRVLALLNITDIVAGEYAGKEKGGVRYRSLTARAELKRKSVIVHEFVMDSEVMDLTGAGSIDFAANTLDLTLLAAPIKTGNRLIRKIPLVRDILSDSLIAIPVSVSGPAGDPSVMILPPSAVGEGLINITKRTLQLPFRIIEPVISGAAKNDQ
ncbi:MAG: AsmA-like C-terminal region-containing protein [Nitrospirota bacterium]|nr:AsmA-like C-terminal region-containing protein [Nitrospirota bacterium]